MGTEQAESAQMTLVVGGTSSSGSRPVGRRKTGRHERALDKSIRAAGLNVDARAAAVSHARALAAALDVAELGENTKSGLPDPYATAQLGRVYREALADLGLIDRGGGDHDDDPLDGLDGPSVVDTPHA